MAAVAAQPAAVAAAPSAPPTVSKSGWLKKRCPHGFLGLFLWQSRFVVVDHRQIRYFRTLEASKANDEAGHIDFDEIVSIKGDPASSYFEIAVCGGYLFLELIHFNMDHDFALDLVVAFFQTSSECRLKGRVFYFDSSDIVSTQSWLEFFSMRSNRQGLLSVDGLSIAVRRRRRKQLKQERDAEVVSVRNNPTIRILMNFHHRFDSLSKVQLLHRLQLWSSSSLLRSLHDLSF